jgi:methyl-accepting chemotaxis protein
MLGLMLVLGVSSRHGMSIAGGPVQEVISTSHILRNHLEADMMHDALRADVLAALLAQTDTERADVASSLREHVDHFRDMIRTNESIATGDTAVALGEVGAALDAYIASAEQIVAVAATDTAAARSRLPEFGAAFKRLEENMAAVSDRIAAGAQTAEQDAGASVANMQATSIGILVVTIAVALLVSTLLVRAIGTGLVSLKGAIGRLARGELGHPIHLGSHDEFGELLGAVLGMDRKFGEVVRAVSGSAEDVRDVAGQLAQGNDDLNQRTQEQAAALEQTASSMEQMAATVKQNAENARAASELAVGVRDQADRGGSIVQSAIAAMQEINTSSRKIHDIIGVIDEIAFQTNLLALNAAVEAARAGEQGRGFAVVASEVRTLAQRSASAAREIKTLIGESVDRVKTGSELVDASGHTMAEIMESVKKVTQIVGEISAASEEQATGIDQVNRAIAQLDEMTQRNAALVEQATAASRTMEHQTTQLTSAVAFFMLQSQPPQTAAAGTSPTPVATAVNAELSTAA